MMTEDAAALVIAATEPTLSAALVLLEVPREGTLTLVDQLDAEWRDADLLRRIGMLVFGMSGAEVVDE